MDNFDISKYIDMLRRRKYWLIISFMVVFLAGTAYLLNTPKIYESETLILVQAQKVPKNFVRPIVSSDVASRLRTITQQVTSRTNLESIIKQNQLYNSPSQSDMLLYDKVNLLRKNVDIHVSAKTRDGGGDAFSITFQGRDPKKVMDVTNALASNFISQNLKIRESQSVGTSDFLADQLDSIKRQLVKKETAITDYKQKHMGEMSDDLNANLSMLARSQQELQALYSRLDDAQDRKLLVQQQMKQSAVMASPLSGVPDLNGLLGSGDDSSGGDDNSGQLEQLKAQLKSLKLKYTDNYPDVKEIQAQIAKLETQQKEEAKKSAETTGKTKNKETSSPDELSLSNTDIMKSQVDQINDDIKKLNNEIADAKKRVAFYNKIIEDTPKVKQGLDSVSRGYNNLREQYDAMLNKKIEASIAVSMEKMQKGEQFKVIDPANMPKRPIKPNAMKIMSLTIVLGLGIGCGLIYLIEFLDTSYKNPEDAEKELSVPVLTSMPFLMTPKEIRTKKNKNIIIAVSLCVGFILAFAGIVLSAKGLGKTLNLIQEIFIRS